MGSKNKLISIIYAFIPRELANSFRKLYGIKQAGEKLEKYYEKKLKLSAAVVIIGIFVYFLFPYIKQPVLINSDGISRNDYGKGSRTVSVGYKINGRRDGNIEITVDEKKYTDKQLEEMTASFIKELETSILGDNESFDHVTKDLNFKPQIKSYPFSVSYKTDRPALLSYSGKIDYSQINSREGEPVTIIITIKYEDLTKEIYEYANICEREKTDEELFNESLINEIDKSSEQSKYSDIMRLPESVSGRKIQYFEKGSKGRIFIIPIAIMLAAALFFGNNDDVKKEIKKRDKQLLSCYPVLINKFAIFYNAGMPIYSIWNKLCHEYEKDVINTGKRKYVYEEMLVTRTMIKDGKNEIEAYGDFAKRCGLKQYKVFISLIQQALTKGKGDMDLLLKKEADEAFVERKNNAKKLSEEASSKLLLPMFMMLIVVMIMIMFPAFNSFN